MRLKEKVPAAWRRTVEAVEKQSVRLRVAKAQPLAGGAQHASGVCPRLVLSSRRGGVDCIARVLNITISEGVGCRRSKLAAPGVERQFTISTPKGQRRLTSHDLR